MYKRQDQEFVLEGIRTLPVPGEEPGDAEEEALFFPLEQMLYLLQVQWFCSQGCVYCFAPEETLWDIVADLSSLYQNQPTYGEIFCTQEGSFNSKGYYLDVYKRQICREPGRRGRRNRIRPREQQFSGRLFVAGNVFTP